MAGTNLAKAYVQIVPSAKGIKGSLTNALSGEAATAGNQAGSTIGSNLVSTLKTALVTAGIGKILQSSLLEGANVQQSLGGIETLFKDSADKVIENAKNAYKTAGMSANEYMETVTSFSASLLQGLAGNTNKAADVAHTALTDMSDNVNKMGTPMELIQNAYNGFAKQNYTMLDNLKLGYGGTKTEMERLLKDAQKLSGVKYDINNLADVYNAIHVIQEEMGITGTTAKEAASTFSGSLASVKAAASNLLADLALGKDMQDSFYALTTTMNSFIFNNLLPMVGNVMTQIPELVEYALGFVDNILNYLRANMSELVKGGTELVGGIVKGIVSALPYLAEAAYYMIAELADTLINTNWLAVASEFISDLRGSLDLAAIEILGTDGNIVASVVEAIQTNIPKVLEAGKEVLRNLMQGMMSKLPVLLESGKTLLRTVINGIVGQLGNIADSAIKIVSYLLDKILENAPGLIKAGFNLVLQLVTGLINKLPEIVSAAVRLFSGLRKTIVDYAPKLIETGLTLIGQLIAGIIKAIPNVIAQIPKIIKGIKKEFTSIDWKSVGKNILSGIAKGIVNGGSAIVDAAKKAAKSALNAAKKALGIKSPSTIFENEVGKMIDMGLAEGIENNTDAVSNSMKELSRATVGMIDTDIPMPSGNVYREDTMKDNMLENLLQVVVLLEKYLPALANMQMVWDTGVAAGVLAPKINAELNQISDYEERGNW